MPHLDAFSTPILPDADVIYSPLNRRGIPFLKAKVVGVSPKKVRIELLDHRGYPKLVEPQRLLVV